MSRHRVHRRPARGFFWVGIHHPKHEVNVGGLWRAASLFGAAGVFTVGMRYRPRASDTMRTPTHTPLVHFQDVGDLIEHLPYGCPLVGVELDPRADELGSFAHPERAAYLLGAEDHGLPAGIRDRCHRLVQVETALPESLNVAAAGAILLHHRHTSTLARPVPALVGEGPR